MIEKQCIKAAEAYKRNAQRAGKLKDYALKLTAYIEQKQPHIEHADFGTLYALAEASVAKLTRGNIDKKAMVRYASI